MNSKIARVIASQAGRRSPRGLTLVEVLVSITVLGVLLFSLTPALMASAILRGQNGQMTIAVSLAQQQIEAIREGWQSLDYHTNSAGDYVNNRLNGLNILLPTVGSAYTFGNFTTAAVNLTIDRPVRWYEPGATLPNLQTSTGQYADMAPTQAGTRVVVGSQFVVRTTVTALGPQSYCSGSTKSPCPDPDAGPLNSNARFSAVRNALSATYIPPTPIVCATISNCRAPVDPNNDVRLFKRVTVTVFLANPTTGAALGDVANAVEMQSAVRTSNSDNLAATITGPLAVFTTEF